MNKNNGLGKKCKTKLETNLQYIDLREKRGNFFYFEAYICTYFSILEARGLRVEYDQ